MRNPLRLVLASCIAVGLGTASHAWAQTAQPSATPNTTSSERTLVEAAALEAGANSFTEGQARSRIEDKGFKNVSGLKKDDSGVWRGKADHNGKAVNVSVDFQGNVVSQ